MKSKNICHTCKRGFYYDKNKERECKFYNKVRDIFHYTGKFRAAAHNICNLTYKVDQKIQVVFHNGSTYDYHSIIKKLEKKFKG